MCSLVAGLIGQTDEDMLRSLEVTCIKEDFMQILGLAYFDEKDETKAVRSLNEKFHWLVIS